MPRRPSPRADAARHPAAVAEEHRHRLAGCPGTRKTGSRIVLPRYFSSIRSPSLRPRSFASCGLTQAVGSHVTFVSGFGSSCSQPLLAKRPSHTVGSGRKMISRPPVAGGVVVLPATPVDRVPAAPACCGAVHRPEHSSRHCLQRSARRACSRELATRPHRQRPHCRRRPAAGRCPRRGLGRRRERRRRTSIRERSAGDEPVVQDAAPERLGILERLAIRGSYRPSRSTAERARPVVLHDLVTAAVGLRGERAQQLVGRTSLVQGRDERLDDRHGAVVGTRVAPRFERVGVGDVPVGQVRRFVGVQTVVDDRADFREPFRELQVAGAE